MNDDVQQAALAVGIDARQTRDRRGIELPARVDHAHAPAALGHQQAAVGQEREAPGILQARDEPDDAYLVLLGSNRLRRRRRRGDQRADKQGMAQVHDGEPSQRR